MDNPMIILGGMGPQASHRLHQLLLEKSLQFHSGQPHEFPGILHASMPVPDFIASSDKYETAVGLVASTCEQLPLRQAGAIGMACNTAHLMVDRLPLGDTAFVSMIDAVTTHIQRTGGRRVGLLASPHTIHTGLYSDALAQKDIESVLPDQQEQLELHDIISTVIAGGDAVVMRDRLSALADSLLARGADCILLGCTELPLVGVSSSAPVVDSLDVLADAMLEKHYNDSSLNIVSTRRMA